ncbi:unnamed protein product, partial [Clonostachys rosea f. rosea IK726]
MVRDGVTDKVESDLASITVVMDQINRQVDEGECHAVIASGFSREQISEMLRHPLGEFTLSDDGRSKNGIRGRDTRGNHQTIQPVKGGDHPPNEQAHNEPAEGHDGDEEVDDGSPVTLHVELGQFHTDGKALDDQNDTGKLDGDDVGGPPVIGVDEVGGMRTEYDSAQGGDSGFTN